MKTHKLNSMELQILYASACLETTAKAMTNLTSFLVSYVRKLANLSIPFELKTLNFHSLQPKPVP